MAHTGRSFGDCPDFEVSEGEVYPPAHWGLRKDNGPPSDLQPFLRRRKKDSRNSKATKSYSEVFSSGASDKVEADKDSLTWLRVLLAASRQVHRSEQETSGKIGRGDQKGG